MDWLAKMNGAIGYIEENLCSDIDYEEVAKRACCSSYNFQRLFSFISDVSLAEYIRRRRLTLAAFDLAYEGSSVLEVALKYRYDSPVSFARAFQNLHGITPKEARAEGAKLKNYPKISFQIAIKGVEEMKYRIETSRSLHLVGVKKEITTKDGQNFIMIPKFWDDIWADGTGILLEDARTEKAWYGVCCNFRETEFDYIVAVKSDQPLKPGFTEIEIPACQWVKFECRGPLPDSQQKVWKRIYSEWFPSSGYEHTGGPEIEWYSEENMDSEEYYSEIWLPVRRITT
ncbi:AraC family transcriptional regulator [Clostridium sp. KNHs205]|uniref:AraC family transcriptional regulator n=1 Tax=Clostridium sp. KNHs205 TaxID=1449050 RepID=UPI00051C2942|nr:AraC family transcriptional regulator [Clostridium sp. KNHs205]